MKNLRPKYTPGRCPKCSSSSVYLDSDEYGWFEHCLQCGYVRDMKVIAEGKKEKTESGAR